MTPAPELTAEERIEKLEAQVRSLQKKPKDLWDKFQSLSGLISGLALLVAGYFVTGSVDRAFRERQFQLSSAKDMQELLAKLNNREVPLDDKESTALVLAGFGKYAIPPLLQQLQSGEPNRALAAETGLRAIGYSDPQNACREFERVIGNRTRLFAWHTQLAVIRLLRDADCTGAVRTLEAYRKIADGPPDGYRQLVRDEPLATAENIDRIRSEAAAALKALRREP